MSVVRDNASKNVIKEINKIIPKSLKKNLIEYDSNPFEKQIEDKINKYNSGKKEKDRNEFNNSIDKNINKTKKCIRTSSAVYLRKHKTNDSFNVINSSNNKKSNNDISSFNNNINDNSNSPSKYSFKDYTKKNKKKNENTKPSTPFRIKKVNNDKFKDVYNESSNSSFIQENYSKNKDKNHKKALNLDDMWKRFEENKIKSNLRKDNIKKKIEAENSKRYNFMPQITKSEKYNNENIDFLKRVEIYKFVSEAKKSELTQKEKQKFNNNKTNNNNNKQKKISLKEVQKNIDEKLKLKKIKDEERQEKHLRKLKELEENEISKCTFNPTLLDSSKRMNNSIIRSRSQINNLDFNKSTSVSRILDTDVSKKMDTSENNLNISKCNLRKDTSFKRDYSMTRLEKIPEHSINVGSNWDLIFPFPEKEKKAAFVKQNFISGDINITKKESEIMMELLRGKFQ